MICFQEEMLTLPRHAGGTNFGLYVFVVFNARPLRWSYSSQGRVIDESPRYGHVWHEVRDEGVMGVMGVVVAEGAETL